LTDPREIIEGRDYGIVALDCWRVTDLATKHELLCEGFGWGSMSEPLVAADITAGRLVILTIERRDGCDHLPHIDIVAAQSAKRTSGPARSALLAAPLLYKRPNLNRGAKLELIWGESCLIFKENNVDPVILPGMSH